MKKILIYTVKNGNFVDSLYHALGRGFNDLGREVIYCYVNDPDYRSRRLCLLNNKDIDFTIGHNELGIVDAERDEKLNNFYLTNEHVAILDDAPYNSVTQKTFAAACPNLLVAYRDRSHYDYLKSMDFKYHVKKYFFLPFGALIDERQDMPENKDIDIIFSGMYYGEPTRSWHNDSINISIATFMDHAADILQADAITVDDAICKTIAYYNLSIEKKELKPVYQVLYEYCKTYRRNKLIEIISKGKIKVSVCSDTWKKSRFANRLNFILAYNTHDILELYKRSKILIQDMAEFNDGSHCRIGDGPLCNAVVVTEQSKYLKEIFSDSELLFFNWDKAQNLPKVISALCKNNFMRNSFIESAPIKVNEHLLPRHAALTILDAVNCSRKARNVI